jgi:ATP-dependent clp protease, ATP-binding subunit clpE
MIFMLCQRCNQRHASIHLTTAINGQKREIELCKQCYSEIKAMQRGQQTPQEPRGFDNLNDLLGAMLGGNIPQRMAQQQANGGSHNHASHGGVQDGGVLAEFGINLTQMAREGNIDPIIGRDSEIERVIEILNRRTKNNPVLIGEAGVGKTAVVEGLANKIVNAEVPEKLMDKEVIRLDVASLVSGTGIRGQFEERMQQLIKELSDNNNIILFIDEVHELVGAGTSQESSMDAGNILKPALARGEMQMVGATTLSEYRKIEKDPALERRLQPVKVNEPTPEQTLTILEGIQEKYEDFHHVKYQKEALKVAIQLSHRYIQDRFLPDKAIDLMDEAGSKKNLTIQPSNPAELKEKIEDAEMKKQAALEREDYEKAAFFRDQISKFEGMLEQQSPESKTPNVTEQDIINIIEIKTGIPVGELKEKEQTQLRDLEDSLAEQVVGQAEAIEKVAKAIRRNRIGLRKKERPIGSFLFLGPTGVGKTELAKSLAQELFGSKESLVRLDMSEYMEKHSTSRLIGSPPGYVGYDEAGQLTETVRRNPYSLILVDEIEKAHPDVLNMFLQILDDGHLTDSQGRTVNFKETIIIMTSNAGSSDNLAASVGFGANSSPTTADLLEKLSNYFRPEFLNRLDGIIEFNALSKENLINIVDIMIDEIDQAIAERNLTLTVTTEAKEQLVELGYNPKMGARPLRRVIEEQIEDQIAAFYLDHPDQKHLKATLNDDGEVIIQSTEE